MNYLQKKKLAFMSIVNRVKGFIRTITGALPLTLEGCVDEESIIDYTLYGQSVQNGTPTPETPVEVESVGEYDETTGKYKIPIKVSGKNLFDISKARGFENLYGGLTSTIDGNKIVVTCSVTARSGNLELGVFPKGTYTISYSCPKGRTCLINTGETLSELTRIGTFTSPNSYTFTLPQTSRVWFHNSYFSNTETSFTVSNIQLEEGTTATEYEPYHEPITTNIYLDEPLGAGQSINYKKDGLPTIPTFKGTSIISADTTIQPSNAEITYYSNVKE